MDSQLKWDTNKLKNKNKNRSIDRSITKKTKIDWFSVSNFYLWIKMIMIIIYGHLAIRFVILNSFFWWWWSIIIHGWMEKKIKIIDSILLFELQLEILVKNWCKNFLYWIEYEKNKNFRLLLAFPFNRNTHTILI